MAMVRAAMLVASWSLLLMTATATDSPKQLGEACGTCASGLLCRSNTCVAPLGVGDVCRSASNQTGSLLNRTMDCPVGSECKPIGDDDNEHTNVTTANFTCQVDDDDSEEDSEEDGEEDDDGEEGGEEGDDDDDDDGEEDGVEDSEENSDDDSEDVEENGVEDVEEGVEDSEDNSEDSEEPGDDNSEDEVEGEEEGSELPELQVGDVCLSHGAETVDRSDDCPEGTACLPHHNKTTIGGEVNHTCQAPGNHSNHSLGHNHHGGHAGQGEGHNRGGASDQADGNQAGGSHDQAGNFRAGQEGGNLHVGRGDHQQGGNQHSGDQGFRGDQAGGSRHDGDSADQEERDSTPLIIGAGCAAFVLIGSVTACCTCRYYRRKHAGTKAEVVEGVAVSNPVFEAKQVKATVSPSSTCSTLAPPSTGSNDSLVAETV